MTRTGGPQTGRGRRRPGGGAFLLPVVLSLLLAGGCGGPGDEKAAGPALDLLTLSPPVLRPGGDLPPLPGPRAWDFGEGLPADWQAGPAGVRVVLRSGGVFLEHPDQPPWLELDAEVDPRVCEKMWADLQPLSGKAAEFYFSCSDLPDYRVGCRSVVHFGEAAGVTRRFDFRFPDPPFLEGTIRRLRLYPGSWNGSAVVHQVGLEPIRGDVIPDRIHTPHRLGLQREFRRCWRLAGAGERSATFRVPGPDAEIHCAAGTLIGHGSGLLRLILETAGEAAAEILRTPFPVEGEGWTEHRAAIGRWAGREVTVRFQVDPAGPPSIRLIGSPRVLAPAPQRRRGADAGEHLLFIVVDSLRADRLSPYGHHRRTAPHLARLAREGELHSCAWTTSSWTVPAVASLLTGCDPERPGLVRGRTHGLPGNRVTMAERLAFDGFHTAAFVANPVLAPDQGFARGFDTWFSAAAGQHQLRAGELVRRTVDWLREYRDGRTFCYLQLHDPSSPYDAPAPEGADAGPSDGFRLGQGQNWWEGNIQRLVRGRQRLGGAGDRDRLRRRYDEEVAYTDRCIGWLIASLKAEGLFRRTTVVVTAAYGEELGDRGFWGNGYSLHRETARVPLIIRRPGRRAGAGAVRDEPVSLLDLMPTLLQLAGVDRLPEEIDGIALPVPAHGRTLAAQTSLEGPLRFSLLRWPYRYLFFDRGAPGSDTSPSPQARWLLEHGPAGEALYRITDDPDERRNLVRELPAVAAELREEAIRRLGPGGAARRLSDPALQGGGHR